MKLKIERSRKISSSLKNGNTSIKLNEKQSNMV